MNNSGANENIKKALFERKGLLWKKEIKELNGLV